MYQSTLLSVSVLMGTCHGSVSSVSAGGEDDGAGEGERQRQEERSRAAPLRQRHVVKCDYSYATPIRLLPRGSDCSCNGIGCNIVSNARREGPDMARSSFCVGFATVYKPCVVQTINQL